MTEQLPAPARRGFAGADWLLQRMAAQGAPAGTLSQLGARVADLVGDWLYGLYHLEDEGKTDWSNSHYITVRFRGALSTYDGDNLTRLVLLAHRAAIRVEIAPHSTGYLRLLFHPRARRGACMWQRHPTIQEAIARFEAEGGT